MPVAAIVCVKQAEGVRGPLSFTSDGLRLAPECRDLRPNEADTFALEQALRLREQGVVDSITCLTAGSPEGGAMLALCLAMGADRAVRLELAEDVGCDEAAIGALLASAIGTLGGRLVLAAQRSDDGGSGIVPAAMARALGVAYLSNVAAVRLAGERIEVERKLERGHRQVWRAALPAVIAVEPGTTLPRYVSVAALILARRRPVETITPAALGIEVSSLRALTEWKGLRAPRRRPKKTGAAIATTGAEGGGRSRAMPGGLGPSRSTEKQLLAGAPEEIATAVVNLLVEREILSRPTS